MLVTIGYSKEQIRVQIDQHGKLRVSGERPLGDNRWNRFRKDFIVPENCNVSSIRAKFENGSLYVMLPKLIPEVREKEEPARAPQKPEEGQKPAAEPKPSTPRDDMSHEPSVGPNGVSKKQEDEKRGEPADGREGVQKVGEREKDQTEEKKHNEKAAGAVGREEGEKGDAVADVQRKEGEARTWERKLKHKVDELGLGFYEPRKIMVTVIVAAVALVIGLGLYRTCKLRSLMEKDGH